MTWRTSERTNIKKKERMKQLRVIDKVVMTVDQRQHTHTHTGTHRANKKIRKKISAALTSKKEAEEEERVARTHVKATFKVRRRLAKGWLMGATMPLLPSGKQWLHPPSGT